MLIIGIKIGEKTTFINADKIVFMLKYGSLTRIYMEDDIQYSTTSKIENILSNIKNHDYKNPIKIKKFHDKYINISKINSFQESQGKTIIYLTGYDVSMNIELEEVLTILKD